MSTIPVRRTARASRNAATDNENANARPSRIITRAKPVVATATAVPKGTGATRTAAATAVVKVAAAAPAMRGQIGKRKRDVLVEVTGLLGNNNVPSNAPGTTKGKEKEATHAVASKPKILSRFVRRQVSGAATVVVKKPLRMTSVSTTSSSEETVASAKGKAMAVKDVQDHKAAASEAPIPAYVRPLVFSRPPVEVDAVEGTERASKKRHVEPPTLEFDPEDESQAETDGIAAELADVDQEAQPERPLWDDLDAEDWDDPVMVSEYVVEVCSYLKEVELATLPDPDYMDGHPELDWEKRGVLVDWILQVHARFRFLQETLFLTTNILDRFLSARPISLSKLQLVGVTCFFIAAKFEETYAPSVAEIAMLADDQYTIEEILRAERYILKIINWDLRHPGPMGWLRRGSKADDCDTRARTVAKYLLEIGCLEWRLVATLPSLLAAAALWLARLVLGRGEWTPNLEHYMTYSEADLLPTVNIMINYILQPAQHESLYNKYAHKRYLKCSVFMKHWVLQRWSEGDSVDLLGDLSAIKYEVRLQREKEDRSSPGSD